MLSLTLQHDKCVEAMKRMKDSSIGAIVCDPPYGLEFMGGGGGWQAGGGFSKPGIGDRHTAWPSFSATTRFGAANPTCAVCGGRLRGSKKCSCEQPHDHWKPIGKRRNPENEGLPDSMTGSGMSGHMRAMREWHRAWVNQAFRVIRPGGVIKAFGGTRTFHHLAAVMREVGFVDIRIEAWSYGSGFPKSMNIGKVIDKAAGAERAVVDTVKGMGKQNPEWNGTAQGRAENSFKPEYALTVPATDAAKQWEGWGTALKPAWEPVVVGRKP